MTRDDRPGMLKENDARSRRLRLPERLNLPTAIMKNSGQRLSHRRGFCFVFGTAAKGCDLSWPGVSKHWATRLDRVENHTRHQAFPDGDGTSSTW